MQIGRQAKESRGIAQAKRAGYCDRDSRGFPCKDLSESFLDTYFTFTKVEIIFVP
jgi:hypothetical protein